MSSSNGKFAEPRMLDIIRRAVLNQAITATERQVMEEFLAIPPQTPVARSRPPSYTEEPREGHSTILPFLPRQQQWSDTGSSIRRTSTHGTNQTGSSGLSNHGQQSDTGSPQASPSGSAHRRQQSNSRSPQASPSASTHRRQQSTTPTRSPYASSSSGSPHQGRFPTNSAVGPRHPGAEGDIHGLEIPDPQRAGDRSDGGQRRELERQDR